GLSRNGSSGSVYDVIINQRELCDVIMDTALDFLKVVPSTVDLIGAEVELIEDGDREKKLKDALQGVIDAFEYIIIDCPPSLSLLTVNALTAAHSVLIPLQCEYYALEGISQIIRTIDLIRNSLNPKLEIEGVLLTMFDSRNNLSHQVAEEARSYFKRKVFETIISRNIRLSESPGFGKPVILYDIMSKGSLNYLDLARELLSRN
ncbi:MAG: AAA family ATPase, partial [Deltaproteobacteria bacterium]|nr:AAA family ATPase [Deltaproteobacteria bacterium]